MWGVSSQGGVTASGAELGHYPGFYVHFLPDSRCTGPMGEAQGDFAFPQVLQNA